MSSTRWNPARALVGFKRWWARQIRPGKPGDMDPMIAIALCTMVPAAMLLLPAQPQMEAPSPMAFAAAKAVHREPAATVIADGEPTAIQRCSDAALWASASLRKSDKAAYEAWSALRNQDCDEAGWGETAVAAGTTPPM